MNIKLTFFGAAQNVTGSCYLLEAPGNRILIDCGLFQERDFNHRNWDPFPIKPDSITAVLLTHAHLDHCGLLPKLVREGFRGKIYCTPATADIARILMLDSAKIQMEDAQFKSKRHQKEGRKGPYPEIPLYTTKDAEAVFPLFRQMTPQTRTTLNDIVSIEPQEAGHILGSVSIKVRIRNGKEEKAVLFSGDLGRWNAPILRDPSPAADADYIVMESTYGDREHGDETAIPDILAEIINTTCKAGGNIVIPSFAVERTQELLYHLGNLLDSKRIPRLPVFVDSPMAISVTEVFRSHSELFDQETQEMLRKGKHPCDIPGLVMCRTVEESKAINRAKGTSIIIAGSGMCTGGRIKYHLCANIGRPESTILFVGYQAVGTLGRQILDGVQRANDGSQKVRILGQTWQVKTRVLRIDGFSSHAGRNELLRWVSSLKRVPKHVFVTHGEPPAATQFAALLKSQKGWTASAPLYKEDAMLE